MPNITRPIVTQAAPQGNAKQRILLFRQAVRSVRRADELRQMHPGLVIGIITAVGIVGLVWLLGHLGFRLGFANTLGIPELLGEPGGGLATGALIVIMLPLRIFETGIEQPLWLMLAFLAVSVPGGALAGAKPVTPGGPKPKPAVMALLWMGSITSALMALVIVAYVVSPFRLGWLSPLPRDLSNVDGWLTGLHVAAGLDGLVVVAAALWMVLAWRLAVPVWMRALAISTTMFALAVVTVAMGMSNALVAHLHLERSVVAPEHFDLVEFPIHQDDSLGLSGVDFDEDEESSAIDDESLASSPPSSTQGPLLIGYTREHLVLMNASDGTVMLDMSDVPAQFRVLERRSIAEALRAAAPQRPEF